MKKKIIIWLSTALSICLGIWLVYRFFLVDLIFPFDKEFKGFVINSSIPIGNLDPKNSNYDGYEKIAAAIGKSKVVFLGEQDHGDAPTFLAKTKLIKYLHEKMGFNVLVFESNFLGLNQSLASEENLNFSTRPDYKDYILPIWTNCRECSELFFYIDSSIYSGNPLNVAGMDPRLFFNDEDPFSIDYLLSSLVKENLFLNDDERANLTKSLKTLVKDEYQSELSSTEIDSLNTFLIGQKARLHRAPFCLRR